MGGVKFSTLKVEFANPIDLTMEDDTTPQESPTFSSTEKMEMEYVTPMELTMRDDTPMGECTTFSTVEKDRQELEETTTDTGQDPIVHETENSSSVYNVPEESEQVETAMTQDPGTRESTGFERSETEHASMPEILFPEDKPLEYGDLVVVDYAEKKKVYKWPAIVFPLRNVLIQDCTARTHDG